jgi:SAM-dependent methyltransferase
LIDMLPPQAGDPGKAASENDGVRVTAALTCALCGRDGHSLYDQLHDQLFDAPGVWSLRRCPGCGFVWLHPRPVAEDLAMLYRQYHTHAALPDRHGPRGRWRDRAKQRVLARAFGYGDGARSASGRVVDRVLSSIEPLRELVGATVMWLHAARRGRLLDVGCGSGAFLTQMRALGWQVCGVEPDPAAARVARERYGLDVTCGTLEEAALPAHRFDAITMNHVVEHVPDPVATLRECGRVLQPRGRLVITTPNVESLGRRRFRTVWRGLEVPRHLQLFSVGTLAECAGRAGLRVEVVRSSANSARWMHAASRLLQRNGILPGGAPPPRVPAAIWLPGLVFWALEWGEAWFRPVGEEVVLVAAVGP